MSKFAIFIPTINRKDLLEESMLTLLPQMQQVEYLQILDNGQQKILCEHPKVLLENRSQNIGVQASWNFGIKYAFDRDIDFLFSLNDDIILNPIQLPEMIDVVENNQDKWLYVGPYYWSVWCISRLGASAMEYAPGKYFDENFYPAYFEDNDFHWRMRLLDETKYLGNVSIFTPKICRNSMSLKKDPTLNSTFQQNKLYYIQKWGGEPGREKFKTPFNK